MRQKSSSPGSVVTGGGGVEVPASVGTKSLPYMVAILPVDCYTSTAVAQAMCNNRVSCQDGAMTSHDRPGAGPTVDVSVRVGWADDALGIAEVQVRAWRREYADLLPAEVLESLDPGRFAAAWQTSLNAPQDARNRVLVALERNTVRGFAVTGPAADPDVDPIAFGEVSELTVEPDHTRRGHGSRLLQACADT